MAAHVLIADDDVHILKMVSTVLTKRGYSVDTALDGEDALARARARPPDLLVTDVMMPNIDGWTLVRKLREDTRLATMPVIFLTALASENDKIRGFRLGADDYILKPVQLDDLVERVAKVLASAAQHRAAKPRSSGLRGDLAQVSLSTLLVLIEMERKTGALALRSPDGHKAEILARDGKVVQARLEHDPRRDAACIFHLLSWRGGEFQFVARAIDAVDRVQLSTTHLLMEGARLADEAAAGLPEPEPSTSLKLEVGELDPDAVAEWEQDEGTPLVVAAKLAEMVRHSARISVPPPFADPPTAVASEPAPEPSASPPARRRRTWALVAAAVIAAAAAGTVVLTRSASHAESEPAAGPGPDPYRELQADADAVRNALELTRAQIKMRGEALAANPVLRAAIETDAATLRDLQRNEKLFGDEPGVTIEVLQGAGTQPRPLLRVPEAAPGLGVDLATPDRMQSDGKELLVAHAAAITDRGSQPVGAVAVGSRCDLTEVRRRLAQHARRATLTGLATPVVLVDAAGASSGPARPFPVSPGLTLVVEPR